MSGQDLLPCDYPVFKRFGFSKNKEPTSDPFVVFVLGNPDAPGGVELGKTPTISKNLNPDWNSPGPHISIDLTPEQAALPALILRIYDEDDFSDPDVMGQVAIPLNQLTPFGSLEWHEIKANPIKPFSSKSGKPKYQGRLQVWAKFEGGGAAPARTPAAIPDSPLEMTGGNALNSAELTALSNILSIAGQLSADNIRIAAPKVAVVGGQSTGKSTIFNVILKGIGSSARFPTGDGTCTKVPTILKLQKGNQNIVTVSAPNFSNPLSPGASSDEVVAAIKAAQHSILVEAFPGFQETDIKFSPTPVTLTAVSPNIPTEIVMVDLPGLVAGPQAEDVKAMVRGQIVAKNTLIVAAAKSDNDDGVDEGLALAQATNPQEIDPRGERTMRLYTFWKQARQVRQNQIQNAISNAPPQTKAHVLDLKFQWGARARHPTGNSFRLPGHQPARCAAGERVGSACAQY